MNLPADINPITEDDIANFLVNTPDFFERHAQVLASIKLTSPHGRRAVSLQERQAEMLRDKIRALEMRLMEMMRHGTENDVLNERLHRWMKSVIRTTAPKEIPQAITHELQHEFMVPQVAIKLWNVRAEFADQLFTQGITDSVKALAAELHSPYVGVRAHEEVLGWLPEAQSVESMALIPLMNHRSAAKKDDSAEKTPANVIGMLVLASPDAQRYHEGMGVDLLEQLGEFASAALTHLS
jgi:uncharacterized protein